MDEDRRDTVVRHELQAGLCGLAEPAAALARVLVDADVRGAHLLRDAHDEDADRITIGHVLREHPEPDAHSLTRA